MFPSQRHPQNKGYSPLPQPLSFPTAESLSREPRELPQTLIATHPTHTQGGSPAALISSVQLSSWNQVGRLIINCPASYPVAPGLPGSTWVWGLQRKPLTMLHSWKPAQAVSQNNSGPQFFCFFLPCGLWGSLFLNQGLNPCPLHWKC